MTSTSTTVGTGSVTVVYVWTVSRQHSVDVQLERWVLPVTKVCSSTTVCQLVMCASLRVTVMRMYMFTGECICSLVNVYGHW